VRVGSIEPSGQPSAQSNGGHIEGNFNAQNPAYRQASHFIHWLDQGQKKRALERVLARVHFVQRVGTKLAANANTELGTFILTG
jgi:hypothetical protein